MIAVKWLYLLCTGLFMLDAMACLAQKDKLAEFDFYIVHHRGDTIRDGIVKITIRQNRFGHIALAEYESGAKYRYNSRDIRAFSYVESYFSLATFKKVYTFHEVQTLVLNDSVKNWRTPIFYEKLDECNGKILYRWLESDGTDSSFEYVIMENNVLKYKLRSSRKHIRGSLSDLMPDCLRQIDEKVWPRWAHRKYKGKQPEKPEGWQ